jgi:uncharacterized protein (TIGR04255 family)
MIQDVCWVMLHPVTTRLKDPPLVEVVCGFFFQPIPGLDPLVVGKYWSQHKEKGGFPKKQLQPPVTEQIVSLEQGVGPLRCWLISDNDEYVLQIQPDRFYFNWRNRAGKYPHFNDYGDSRGVLSLSLSEFAAFDHFIGETLEQRIELTRVELAKIDLLRSPKHWADYNDLTKMLPMLARLPQIIPDPAVNLSFVGERDNFDVRFRLATSVLSDDMSLAVQMETRVGTAAKDVEGTKLSFKAMNDVANRIFFETVDANELKRFGGT